MSSGQTPSDEEPRSGTDGELRGSSRRTRNRDQPDLWEELGLERSDDVPVPTEVRTQPTAERRSTRPVRRDDDGAGRAKIMAILSHLSLLFGIPVFLAPLVLRRDAHSLHHAKSAALIYFAFYTVLAAAMFALPSLTPVAMLLYLPGLVGIYRAVRGERAGVLGFGFFAEALFPWPDTDRK